MLDLLALERRSHWDVCFKAVERDMDRTRQDVG
jgi:hypothetical protein